MKKILVTGATGFIGSNCIELLIKRDYEIHAISRNSIDNSNNNNIFWYKIDLFDVNEIERIFKEVRPSHFMHLAWKMETGLMLNSEENEKWLYLSQNLIDLFYQYGGERILVSGSCFEYDLTHNNICHEKTQLIPNSSYGISKMKLYQYLKSICDKKNLSYVWGRIFFTYGPGQKAKSLVPYVVGNLCNNNIVETTDGNQIYDYLYVEDIALALILLLESPHQGAVNISSGNPLTLKKLILKIAEIFERKDLIEFGVKPRPKDSPDYIVGDNTLLKKITSWNQHFELNEGIKKFINFYKKSSI